MDRVEATDKSKIPNQDDEKREGPKNCNFEDADNEEENEKRDEDDETPGMRQESIPSIHLLDGSINRSDLM